MPRTKPTKFQTHILDTVATPWGPNWHSVEAGLAQGQATCSEKSSASVGAVRLPQLSRAATCAAALQFGGCLSSLSSQAGWCMNPLYSRQSSPSLHKLKYSPAHLEGRQILPALHRRCGGGAALLLAVPGVAR